MENPWKPSISGTKLPLSLAIVQALSDDIASGRLATDKRLPTQRELAEQLGVAVGTVTRAYNEAERRGLIRSEGRRGTFVGGTPSRQSRLATIAESRPDAIDLGKNHPSYTLDPDLPHALRQLGRSQFIQRMLEYPPASGIMRHREAGAAWFGSLGTEAEPESVFVTAGAQHALSLILSTETRRGDVVAAESFSYPGFAAVAEQLDLHVAALPADEDGILPDALESLCRQRQVRLLYCNPSLSNPTNSVWPATRRREVADIAARHGVTILEDDIMRPFLKDHPGFISNLLPQQSFLVMSASKCIAAGLRVGFILAPAEARQRLVESLNASCLGTPPLMAEVFSFWYANGTVDRVIDQRRRDTATRQKVAEDVLRGYEFRNHPASYHVWLRLPEGWTGVQLAMEAQLHGTVVAPGEVFAVNGRPPFEAVRLSVVVPPSHEALRSGLQTIADLLGGSAERQLPTV